MRYCSSVKLMPSCRSMRGGSDLATTITSPTMNSVIPVDRNRDRSTSGSSSRMAAIHKPQCGHCVVAEACVKQQQGAHAQHEENPARDLSDSGRHDLGLHSRKAPVPHAAGAAHRSGPRRQSTRPQKPRQAIGSLRHSRPDDLTWSRERRTGPQRYTPNKNCPKHLRTKSLESRSVRHSRRLPS